MQTKVKTANRIPTTTTTTEYFGDLHSTANGEYRRSATQAEAEVSASRGSVHGCTGPIEVDGESCYVENAAITTTTATFAEACQAECLRLGVERLTPSQVAGIRETRRVAAAAAAGVAISGRVAISSGKETIHLASGTSRVRVLFGRQATPSEIALGIRAQIAALQVRSSAFTGELLHSSMGRIATLKSRLASL